MKRSVSCDQVFDILTRGPFPSGDPTDSAVEAHLSACHECRQLAEALRPAVALFHESIPSHELENLPGYHGALCSTFTDAGIATKLSLETAKPLALPSDRWPRLHEFAMSRFAAGIVLSISLFALAWSLAGPTPAERSDATLAARPPATTLQQQISTALGDLQLTNACWTHELQSRPTNIAMADSLQCCSRCHHSMALDKSTLSANLVRIDSRPSAVANAISLTCQICHHEALEQ